MTRNEILRRYPNASESFIRRNLGADYIAPELPNPELKSHDSREDNKKVDRREKVGEGRCRVMVESRRSRLCDIDNLYVKAVLDAVRYARLIQDDSPDAIELVVRQTKVKKIDEETVITIEAI